MRACQARWTDYDRLLGQREGGRFRDRAAAWGFPRAYRQVCRDLNLARAQRFSLALVDRLNRMVWAGHQLLYRQRGQSPLAGLRGLVLEFPAALRRFRAAFLLCHVLFYGLAGLAFLYCAAAPEHVRQILGDDTLAQLSESYDPANRHFLKPRGVSTDADMFGFYIYNNISIGLRTFAGGALAGVGSLAMLVFNAIFLGAAAAHIHQSGFDQTFFSFVLGHGAFELTAIIIFSLAGFELGKAIIMPGRLSRSGMLRRQGQAVLPLVAGATLFLVVAATLEAFWSSSTLAPVIKFRVAAVLWALVYGFMIFGGRRGRKPV